MADGQCFRRAKASPPLAERGRMLKRVGRDDPARRNLCSVDGAGAVF